MSAGVTYGTDDGSAASGYKEQPCPVKVQDQTDGANVPLTADCHHRPLIPPTSERSVLANLAVCVVLAGCGALEGAGFERSGIAIPSAIGGQMVFKVWIVLKMFMSAVGSSMFFQGLLSQLFENDFDRSRNYKTRRFGFARVIIGGVILGSGMAFAGSGPTMLPAQVGSGVDRAWAVVVGCFIGGLLFAVMEKVRPTAFEPRPEPEDFTVETKFVKKANYQMLAVPAGLVMIGISTALEFIVPQWKDADRFGFGPRPWYPTIAGCIVGLNQVPLRLLCGHGQGGSTSFMNVIGTLTGGFLAPKQQIKGFQQIWQVVFVWIGSTMGALASAQINDSERPPGFPIWRGIVGGILMILGGRIAGGCTCGHGISGFSELGLESIVAACCIFGSGIATGYIIQAAGDPMCCHY